MQPLDVSTGFDVAAAMRLLQDRLGGSGAPPLWPVGPDGAIPSRKVGPQDLPTTGSPVAALLPTSGSTGSPKRVVLTTDALVSSGRATHERLGGPGQWVLALPAQHVAGFQVLCRSVLAGTTPQVLTGSFSTAGFAAAVERMSRAHRRYASLVPTQLIRLLHDPVGLEALGHLDAVLVGGAALPRAARALVEGHQVPVVATYGMTETSGGCVYDGRPLAGVRVECTAEGRVRLGGPVVAAGYLGRPALTAERFEETGGTRWFRTDDAGTIGPADRLVVHGRLDDVILTGGHKAAPGDVEEALLRLPGVLAAHVQGVPDEEWGERVAAVVVLADPPAPDTTRRLRDQLRPLLPAHSLPRQVLVLPELPLLAAGKPDRVRLRAMLLDDGGRM